MLRQWDAEQFVRGKSPSRTYKEVRACRKASVKMLRFDWRLSLTERCIFFFFFLLPGGRSVFLFVCLFFWVVFVFLTRRWHASYLPAPHDLTGSTRTTDAKNTSNLSLQESVAQLKTCNMWILPSNVRIFSLLHPSCCVALYSAAVLRMKSTGVLCQFSFYIWPKCC